MVQRQEEQRKKEEMEKRMKEEREQQRKKDEQEQRRKEEQEQRKKEQQEQQRNKEEKEQEQLEMEQLMEWSSEGESDTTTRKNSINKIINPHLTSLSQQTCVFARSVSSTRELFVCLFLDWESRI